MFKVGGYAIPIGSKIIKVIDEIEIIFGEHILYMSDGSSYHVSQLIDIHQAVKTENKLAKL